MKKNEILEAQQTHLELWESQLDRYGKRIRERPPGPRRKEMRRSLTHLRRRREMLENALVQAAKDGQWRKRFELIEKAVAEFRDRALRLDFTLQEA